MSKELTEILKLRATLDHYNEKYYDEDVSEITDAEYDALKNRYIELSGKEYDYVPGNANFNRFTHKHKILSLEKVNNKAELRKELIRLAPGVIQPKYDGLTLVIEDDEITTRGNGIDGEIVTDTAKYVDNIASCMKGHDEYVSIRGEAYIKKSTFKQINEERMERGEKPFENARNAVAGIIRKQHGSALPTWLISFTAYDIPGMDIPEVEKINNLSDIGYRIPYLNHCFTYTMKNIDDAMNWIKDFEENVRETLDYEIDGLVIKSNQNGSLARFGTTGHHPKNAVAYKFANQGLFTAVTGVTWQTGRTGKITPVAELEPIKILGSTISRATLNNMGYIQSLGLSHLGQLVKVVKANDVIPCIVEVNQIASRTVPNPDVIVEPTECPACGGPVKKVNDQLFCANNNCSSKLANMIAHIAKRDALDIDGLSIETAQKMVDMDLIQEPYQLFGLSVEQIQSLAGFAKKSAVKLYNAIQGARKPEFKNFLYAAGVKGIGRSMCEDLANHHKTFATFFKDINTGKCQGSMFINGVGEATVRSMIENRMDWAKLYYYVVPKDVEEKEDLKDMFGKPMPSKNGTSYNFVITGTLTIPRSEVEYDIKAAGHKLTGSVSSKTDYVVLGDNPGGTKYDKAKSLGTKMISEEGLYNLIGK